MNRNSENIPATPRFFLKKEERLRSKKQMEKLFSEGNSFLFYPLKIVYIPMELTGSYPAKVAFAVSKKLFKHAVKRNLIRRRMREAYRLNKYLLVSDPNELKKAVFFIYIGKGILDFQTIEKAMKRSLTALAKSIARNP